MPSRPRGAISCRSSPDGHWCGELEGDTILESEYVLTLHFLGRTGETRFAKVAEHLRRKQLPGGGWAIYEGGPPDVSASVKAYFVLKLAGDDAHAPHMARARHVILELGGIEACNSFTRIYLSIFGQCSWDDCPAVPPELVLLPDSGRFNIYKMSSWSRGIVVPLVDHLGLEALLPGARTPRASPSCTSRGRTASRETASRARAGSGSGRRFFTRVDATLKLARTLGPDSAAPQGARGAPRPGSTSGSHESDGLGAIFPPIINTIIAFRCLGYALDDPRALGAGPRSSRSSSSRTRRRCACSPASRPSGTRRSRSSRWRSRASPPTIPRS